MDWKVPAGVTATLDDVRSYTMLPGANAIMRDIDHHIPVDCSGRGNTQTETEEEEAAPPEPDAPPADEPPADVNPESQAKPKPAPKDAKAKDKAPSGRKRAAKETEVTASDEETAPATPATPRSPVPSSGVNDKGRCGGPLSVG